MNYLSVDQHGVIHRIHPEKNGQFTLPVGHTLIEGAIDPTTNAPFVLEEELNPNMLDISIHDWDDVNKCLVLSSHKVNLKRQTDQREFGEHLIKEIIDMMGARNLDLIQSNQVIDISSLAQDNAGVKLLVETGALATASMVCSQLKIKYPLHADIYDYLIADINMFLSGNGWL